MNPVPILSYQPLPLVRPADLYELFEQVVGAYAFTACAYLGRPNAEPGVSLDVEFKVEVSGALKATLVLRTTAGGARQLALGIRPDADPSPPECADAFREISNFFVGHLLTSCMGGRRYPYDPFLPKPSTPAAWPAREPDAACALLLETEAVELRYWQEPKP